MDDNAGHDLLIETSHVVLPSVVQLQVVEATKASLSYPNACSILTFVSCRLMLKRVLSKGCARFWTGTLRAGGIGKTSEKWSVEIARLMVFIAR